MANAAARRTLKREVPLEIGPRACIENFNPVLYLAVCRLDEPVHPHLLRRRFKEGGSQSRQLRSVERRLCGTRRAEIKKRNSS